ncbi:MAG: response regulator [Acidobacteriota bacterium]|nr:response regulator [Acidobacteriota bacterium]
METILVVDDTGSVLKVVVSILEAASFHVLQADGGTKAVKMAAEYPGRIDLLLSDIKMPEMSGPELGELLKKTRPEVRVMLMSGFSGDLLVLNYGWAFISKPFLAKKLVEMVTEVLHTPDKSQGSNQFDKRKDKASE